MAKLGTRQNASDAALMLLQPVRINGKTIP